jgi:hypothetical protein
MSDKPANDLIDETCKENSARLSKLQRYCNVTCQDDKDLCEVCTIRAMRYAIRMFQVVFGEGK